MPCCGFGWLNSIFTSKTLEAEGTNDHEGVSASQPTETNCKDKEGEVPVSAPPAQIKKAKSKGDHDILIAVMGATGVGKTSLSTIFSSASRFNMQHLSLYGLSQPPSMKTPAITGSMQERQRLKIDLPDLDDDFVPVDTPGFDDPTRPNSEVLGVIAKWMADKAVPERLIYLHRITDIRFDSGASTTMSIFRKLYGGKGYQRLALVTTMWNDVQENRWTEFSTKETELKTIAWGPFLQRAAGEAALVSRFDSTSNLKAKESALKVISDLLKQSIDCKDLRTQLQRELVDEKKAVPRTEAGKAAFTLAETAKYYLRQIS